MKRAALRSGAMPAISQLRGLVPQLRRERTDLVKTRSEADEQIRRIDTMLKLFGRAPAATPRKKPNKRAWPHGGIEKAVLQALKPITPSSVDELSKSTGLTNKQVGAKLYVLRQAKKVKRGNDGWIRL